MRYRFLTRWSWWLCAPTVLLASCALDPVKIPHEGEVGRVEEGLRRECRSDADCPAPGAPCRQCADGSFACPEVDCVRRQCVYSFPQCPPPYEPCAGKACGERCTVCDPLDPDCVETAVLKYCQADASCAPSEPVCQLENPCAAVLCPTGTECVVLESFPPQARCVPIDACATVRCAAGTHCEAGACVPDVAKVFCGGIAGIPCPGAGTCIDDPSDDCDPRTGGADCGGMCVCKALGLCVQGFHWDSAPGVCGCVPDGSQPNCGSSTCGAGEYCCNPSCSICAPLGGACIQIACAATE